MRNILKRKEQKFISFFYGLDFDYLEENCKYKNFDIFNLLFFKWFFYKFSYDYRKFYDSADMVIEFYY